METTKMILAAATLSNWLGLVGALLTVVGVMLTLIGTRKFRSWLAARRPTPAVVGVVASTADADIATPRVRVGPPHGIVTLEWLAEDHQRQIDALAAEIQGHHHPDIYREIARAERNIANVQTDVVGRIEGLDQEAARAEKWSIWGLVVVGAGAILQVGAVIAATIA